jgi:FlaA1/EpsC-like NDP-sugar epimerase
LRFNFSIPHTNYTTFRHFLIFIILMKIIVFYFFDLYKGMWRYTSIGDLINIIKASSVSSMLIVVLIVFTNGFSGLSRSIFIIDWVLTVVLVLGSRLGIRLYFWLVENEGQGLLKGLALIISRRNHYRGAKKLIIIGAGDCGEKIYREIRDNSRLRYNVVGFLDDDPDKTGMKLHGIPILGGVRELTSFTEKLRADEALIAIPSASSRQMREIVTHCDSSGIPYKTVPGMGELIDGKVTVKAIRDVAFRDLLGREVIRLEEDRIASYLKEARILVTGAGGSIGSELCRQICRFRPEALLLYERAESQLYDIVLELKSNFRDMAIEGILGDIRDRKQLSQVFIDHRPQVVFHAAAYKHVPMMEMQPWKAVKNNILGTRNVLDMADQYGVERFVLVSTDKAVRPTNVMGASKRVAELLTHYRNGHEVGRTKFMTVRFGNVVGSSGSVVPLFKKQIEKGGPVTVTHPEITRYFMTVPEACQLILQAGGMGEGGEIFILDMGTPVKIIDMARDLIRLSGFEPDTDIPIQFIGLRPGEKLHEELITEGEGILQTSHEKIMVLKGRMEDGERLNGTIDEMAGLAYEQDAGKIRLRLQEIVKDYQPQFNGTVQKKN